MTNTEEITAYVAPTPDPISYNGLTLTPQSQQEFTDEGIRDLCRSREIAVKFLDILVTVFGWKAEAIKDIYGLELKEGQDRCEVRFPDHDAFSSWDIDIHDATDYASNYELSVWLNEGFTPADCFGERAPIYRAVLDAHRLAMGKAEGYPMALYFEYQANTRTFAARVHPY